MCPANVLVHSATNLLAGNSEAFPTETVLGLGVDAEWPLAQSVEQQTFNLWVVGSIPTGPTLL